VQPEFNRAIALLHSFAYKDADEAFHRVAQQDTDCAIAHWGSAMTHYHQLWDIPPSPVDTAAAKQEITQAVALKTSERERAFIQAFSLIVSDTSVPYTTRASRYEEGMQRIATANPQDPEAQVFYALALISNASPLDKQHRKQ